jgi:hypothetical protein
MENRLALDQRKKYKALGFWAKMGVTADGAKGRAGEATSASYL